jgi:hypothetical protein
MEKVPPPVPLTPAKGVVKDGVWTMEEFGQTLRLEAANNKAVDLFRDAAVASEKKITPQLEAMVGEIKSKFPSADLSGLDYSVKGADSLKRKVVDKLTKNPDINKVLGDVKDAVRYTMVVDDVDYVAAVQRGIAELETRFTKLEVKNSWLQNRYVDKYRGINTVWKDTKTGQTFEFQFHTPKSLSAKTVEHPWYELQRVPGTTQLEIDHAIAQAELIYADVPFPDGAVRIPEFGQD